MNVLEKILEEIDKKADYYETNEQGREHIRMVDMVGVEDIIRSHMDDVPDNNDGWIPVSEKLPEEGDGKYYPLLNVSTSYGVVKCGFYRVRNRKWYIYEEFYNEFMEAKEKEVVAWQTFPEPMRKE